MLSLGIDLATRKGVTGVCELDWRAGARVVSLAVGSPGDDQLAEHFDAVTGAGGWVAIDAPFGFPRAFSDAVATWNANQPVLRVQESAPAWLRGHAPWDPVNRRLTDGYVHVRLSEGRVVGDRSVPWPLSSMVERITPTVIRCATLLSRTTPVIDRIGYGTRVVETYPVAALRLWGFPTTGYKGGRGEAARRGLLAALVEQAPWLDLGAFDDALIASDDAIDALVCALVARLAADPQRRSGPDATPLAVDIDAIKAEGWIHLPPRGHALGDLAS